MTKLVKGMKNISYEDRLQKLNLTTLEERHSRQDLITLFSIFNSKIDIEVQNILEIQHTSITRGNSMKIKPKTVHLESRRNSFFCRVWKTWNKLPEEAVKAKSMIAFKKELERSGIIKGSRTDYPVTAVPL